MIKSLNYINTELLLENVFKRFQKIKYVVLNYDEIDAMPYLVFV